jgi:hypothetical protein
MFDHDSIADIHEKELVEYLLAVPYWQSWTFQHFGIPKDLVYRECVPTETVPDGLPIKSDIDIILCGRGRFEEAVTYQVKLVKVSLAQLRAKTPAKLRELQKGVRQANQLAERGFWKVFLYVVALIDARELNLFGEDRLLFNEVKGKIASAVSNTVEGLNSRVGVFDFEFVQTTDDRPTIFNQSGGHLRRQATPALQSYELTKWVTGTFASGESKTLETDVERPDRPELPSDHEPEEVKRS